MRRLCGYVRSEWNSDVNTIMENVTMGEIIRIICHGLPTGIRKTILKSLCQIDWDESSVRITNKNTSRLRSSDGKK